MQKQTQSDRLHRQFVNLRKISSPPLSLPRLHKSYFFVQEIVCRQNCFRCTSMQVGNRARKIKDLHVTNNNLIGDRNCTKLVLNPLAAKNGLSFSVLCTALFLQIILFQFTWWVTLFMYTTRSIYRAVPQFLINGNEKRCSESNILTMDYKSVLENFSSVAVFTLLNTIIYLKAIKYLSIRLRQIC